MGLLLLVERVFRKQTTQAAGPLEAPRRQFRKEPAGAKGELERKTTATVRHVAFCLDGWPSRFNMTWREVGKYAAISMILALVLVPASDERSALEGIVDHVTFALSLFSVLNGIAVATLAVGILRGRAFKRRALLTTCMLPFLFFGILNGSWALGLVAAAIVVLPIWTRLACVLKGKLRRDFRNLLVAGASALILGIALLRLLPEAASPELPTLSGGANFFTAEPSERLRVMVENLPEHDKSQSDLVIVIDAVSEDTEWAAILSGLWLMEAVELQAGDGVALSAYADEVMPIQVSEWPSFSEGFFSVRQPIGRFQPEDPWMQFDLRSQPTFVRSSWLSGPEVQLLRGTGDETFTAELVNSPITEAYATRTYSLSSIGCSHGLKRWLRDEAEKERIFPVFREASEGIEVKISGTDGDWHIPDECEVISIVSAASDYLPAYLSSPINLPGTLVGWSAVSDATTFDSSDVDAIDWDPLGPGGLTLGPKVAALTSASRQAHLDAAQALSLAALGFTAAVIVTWMPSVGPALASLRGRRGLHRDLYRVRYPVRQAIAGTWRSAAKPKSSWLPAFLPKGPPIVSRDVLLDYSPKRRSAKFAIGLLFVLQGLNAVYLLLLLFFLFIVLPFATLEPSSVYINLQPIDP